MIFALLANEGNFSARLGVIALALILSVLLFTLTSRIQGADVILGVFAQTGLALGLIGASIWVRSQHHRTLGGLRIRLARRSVDGGNRCRILWDKPTANRNLARYLKTNVV